MGAGKLYRDSKFGLLTQGAVTAVVAIGAQLLTDLQVEAASAVGILAGLVAGWITAKRAKHTSAV